MKLFKEILVGALTNAVAWLIAAWFIMLLVDPATGGAYSVSYEQAVFITLLISTVVNIVQFDNENRKR